MGQKSSRTAPEHVEEDRHSAWGSDIDETLCGPGTLCADDWTPFNSVPTSPDSVRRRFSEARLQEDVITEQPRLFDNHSREQDDDRMMNYEVMTIREVESPIILPGPIYTTETHKKKRKVKKQPKRIVRRKMRKQRNTSTSRNTQNNEDVTVLRNFNSIKHHQKPRNIAYRPRHHSRKIRVHQDPRYPTIPPPTINYGLKFRRCHPDDKNRFVKAVPPSHLKGKSISAKQPFRYRGIPKIIM
ncbi:Titin [Caenorhabditis elegans]|uniref:Titin n=1 Tax=Caenorhabditis elegans TaxID=6239 RepID=Q9XUQ7_CAEEL|nr:Titin [Caenorhabditis elegans]CAB04717.2 Titin [Caenorhabditis elegans]|eukprot:NP_506483.2 Uncharacterized protein CELE_T08G5.1 [Caenorhabditis elegans]